MSYTHTVMSDEPYDMTERGESRMNRHVKSLTAGCLLLALVGLLLISSGCQPPPQPVLDDNVLKFTITSDNSTATGKHWFWKINVDGYVFKSGDTIEYDVYLGSYVAGLGGIEIYTKSTDPALQSFRGQPDWIDSDGLSGHPSTDLRAKAYTRDPQGTWYHRVLPVPANMVGITMRDFDLAVEHTSVSETYEVYYDNIVINSTDGTSKVIFKDGRAGDPSANESRGGAGYDPLASRVEVIRKADVPVAPEPPDDVLKFVATYTGTAPASGHYYHIISNEPISNYTWRTGDTIEYDVFLADNIAGLGGIEIWNKDGTSFRSQPDWIDDQGLHGRPSTDLSAKAYGKWYHRVLPLPAGYAGKTAQHWNLAIEYAPPSGSPVYTAYYDNIVVKNGGNVVKTIYVNGDPSHNKMNGGTNYTTVVTKVDKGTVSAS